MSSTYTVSQLNRRIAQSFKLDKQLHNIAVTGEISNLRVSNNGHMYFTLKDSQTSISAVMFGFHVEQLRFMPEDGMEIIAIGEVEFYEVRGSTQLKCTSMAPMGAGRVLASIEQTKKKLADKGVFSEENKQKLPKSPKTIGVVTSPGGAVIQDIINVVSRRYAGARIIISPATVQGELAESSVCEAIKRADNAGCDVIILARGGGSAEDLMPFNSEKITMAVFDCKTPIISAVGHETDTTLADYAADMRAPTPSAAAEIAVPETRELGHDIDTLISAMKNAMRIRAASAENGLSKLTGRLLTLSPDKTIRSSETHLQDIRRKLEQSIEGKIDRSENRLRGEYSRLDALNPLAVLSRGYAIVTDADGKTVKRESIRESDTVSIRTSEMLMTARVLSVEDTVEVEYHG